MNPTNDLPPVTPTNNPVAPRPPQPSIKDSSWFPKLMFFGKICFVFFLTLFMAVPIDMIKSLVREREHRGTEAEQEVTGIWGGIQTINGPVLVVPFLIHDRDRQNKIINSTTHYAYFLPQNLDIRSSLAPEIRSRGIFKVPVYQGKVQVNGTFAKPDMQKNWKIPETDVLWSEAYLTVAIPQSKTIQEKVVLNWDGQKVDFQPGAGSDRQLFTSGIHVPISSWVGGEQKFSFSLQLAGSGGIYFVPLGQETSVQVQSSWTNPKFSGVQLPTTRESHAGGFTAEWKSQYLGRNYPQAWLDDQVKNDTLVGSAFGVDLLLGVENYLTIERSIKYSILFILLTFVTFFLFEIFNKIRVHPIQYLLVGFALCLFYLVLLSLAEHIDFAQAYLAASAATILLVSFYSAWILQNGKRAFFMGLLMAGLYAYLFTLLRMQDYALLMGALGLFGILATIMLLTRKVDWYQLSAAKK